MLIDHIFIFCSSRKEADELISFGLTEGSGRTHQGIGTANRRFFFEDFYLEILWVHNESESKSVKEIGIWERSNFQNSGYSRFGLCLKNTKDTDKLFTNSLKWEPLFLPQGNHVDIITSDNMPWIFRFPSNRRKNLSEEPKIHKSGIKKLSKAIFKLPMIEFEDHLNLISVNSIVEFAKAQRHSLLLEFDNGKQGKEKIFDGLDLVFNY